MVLEHYPGMTERAIARIADQACARWPLTGCTWSTASADWCRATRSCWS
jgi:hypothetical protein